MPYSNSEILSNFEETQVEPLIYGMDDVEQDNAKGGNAKGEKCCGTLILIFFFLVGLAILLFWLIVKPRTPIFTVSEGSIYEYNLTSSNHLNAAFSFAVSVYNPNTKLDFGYEFMDIKAYHGGQIVGYAGVYPFLQPHGNVTYLRFGGVASDMPLFESPGEVDINVELKGKFWYKIGSLKFNVYKLTAKCFPVVVYFNSTREFHSTNCYLKLK